MTRHFALLLTAVFACSIPVHATGTSPRAESVLEEADESPLLAKRRKRRRRKSKKKRAAEAAAKKEAAQKAADEAAKKEAAAKEAAEKVAQEEAAKALAENDAKKEKAAKAKADQKAALEREQAAAASRAAVEAQGIDARVRRLSDAIARDLKRRPGDHRDQSFAVLQFDELGDDIKSKQLGLVVTDLVITNLVRDHHLSLAERAKLNDALAEKELAAAGFTDGDASGLSELVGAEALVVGSISDVGEAYKISARSIDSDGEIISAHDVTVPKEELIALSADAVVLRSRSGGLFRSLLIPGFGQLYNGQPAKALIAGGTVGTLVTASTATLGAAVAMHMSYASFCTDSGQEFLGCKDVSIKERSATLLNLRNTANSLYITSAVLFGVTAVAWGINAADAYISGVDVNSLDEALAE